MYVLEVNPRASRTVPFVSKATGMPLAKAAAKVMVGVSLAEQGYTTEPVPKRVSVKEAVFPFVKFAGVDIVLGPEMKSTGEVMGISEHFPIAFAKSQLAAGTVLPMKGKVFISVADRAKEHIPELAKMLEQMGYELIATRGTALCLEQAGVKVQTIKKIQEGHPNVIDFMIDGDLQLVMNTPRGKGAGPTKGGFARPPSRTASHASPPSKPPTRQSAPCLRLGAKTWKWRPCRIDFRSTRKCMRECRQRWNGATSGVFRLFMG